MYVIHYIEARLTVTRNDVGLMMIIILVILFSLQEIATRDACSAFYLIPRAMRCILCAVVCPWCAGAADRGNKNGCLFCGGGGRYMAGEALDPRGTKKIHIEDKLLATSGIRPVGPTVRRLTTDQEIPRSNRGQDYDPLLGS